MSRSPASAEDRLPPQRSRRQPQVAQPGLDPAERPRVARRLANLRRAAEPQPRLPPRLFRRHAVVDQRLCDLVEMRLEFFLQVAIDLVTAKERTDPMEHENPQGPGPSA